MTKQQQPKENPLKGKNIPPPPRVSAEQPIRKEKRVTVPNSTLHQNSNTVTDGTIQQSDNAVKQQRRKTAQREKMTFYLEPEQANKLYDFMEAFRKRTGIKINQQDMLRRIVDVIELDAVLP